MANIVRIKRRVTGGAGAPASLKSGEIAINMVTGIVYAGYGDDGSGNATSIKPIAGEGYVATGYKELPIKAAGMFPRAGSAGPAPYIAVMPTHGAPIGGYAFDAATEEFIETSLIMPGDYTGGPVYAKLGWGAALGSGNVVWKVAANFLRDDDAIDAAAGTAQTVTDGLLALGDTHLTAWTPAITPGGSYTRASGARTALRLVVSRDAANGSDTFSSDAILTDILLAYPVDQTVGQIAFS